MNYNLVRCSSFATIIPLVATVLSAQTVRYNTGDPLRFGMGYNTLTGEYAGNCTVNANDEDIKSAGDDSPAPGQLSRWELSSESDLASLTEKIDFSASASASFVAGSASLSTQYMKSKAFNRYHEFLYVSAAVTNNTRVWTKPALSTSGPVNYAKLRNRPLEFLKACGDTFIKTITTGGELTAILDITTTAQEDTENLSVSVSGDFSGAAGQAKFAQEIQQRLANHRTQVSVFRNGGTGSLPTFTVDELISASLNFPSVIAAHPVPMQAQLASYDTITPPVELTGAQQQFIKPLFRAYRRAMGELGNLAYVQSHTSEFRRVVPIVSSTSVNASASADSGTLVRMLAEFNDRNQPVVPGKFDFGPIDAQRVSESSRAQQAYADSLEDLARACLTSPETKCDPALSRGTLAKAPPSITDLVRIFYENRAIDTKAGPVDITLDPAYYCKVDYIAGNWKPGDGRTLACNGLPREVTNGHIVTGDFDGPNWYGDNVGICTYQFMCTRR